MRTRARAAAVHRSISCPARVLLRTFERACRVLALEPSGVLACCQEGSLQRSGHGHCCAESHAAVRQRSCCERCLSSRTSAVAVAARGLHTGMRKLAWKASAQSGADSACRACMHAVTVGDLSDGPRRLRAGAAQGALCQVWLRLQCCAAHLPHRGHPGCAHLVAWLVPWQDHACCSVRGITLHDLQ